MEIITIKAQDLITIKTIEAIIIEGYNKTNRKFNINFQGSKGYVNHIEIDCEANKEQIKNRIFLEEYKKNDSITISFDKKQSKIIIT